MQWSQVPTEVRLELESEKNAKAADLSTIVCTKKELIRTEDFVGAQLLKVREVVLQKQLHIVEELLQQVLDVEDMLARNDAVLSTAAQVTQFFRGMCCKLENVGTARSNCEPEIPQVDAVEESKQLSKDDQAKKEKYDCDVTDQFRCCITQEIMQRPVVASDGHTYEHWAIAEWFENHKTSPKTGKKLPDTVLRPNHSLRAQISAWHELKSLAPLPPQMEPKLRVYAGFSVGQRVVCLKGKAWSNRALKVGDKGTVVQRWNVSEGKVPVRWDAQADRAQPYFVWHSWPKRMAAEKKPEAGALRLFLHTAEHTAPGSPPAHVNITRTISTDAVLQTALRSVHNLRRVSAAQVPSRHSPAASSLGDSDTDVTSDGQTDI